MVTELRIYFEGDRELRQGISQFLREIRETVRRQRCRFRLVAGEAQAVADFCHALQSHPEAWNILLVDSEGPDDGQLLRRLQQRHDWKPPAGCHNLGRSVFWMVEVMESWFLADRGALRFFYGNDFRENSLPGNPNVEQIPKSGVLRGLEQATRNCRKGAYHKTRHAPQILMRIDPERVRRAAPNCKRLFDTVLARFPEKQ